MNEIYFRSKYIEKIKPFVDSELVKVLTGVRRCGKSTIMGMIITELMNNGILKDNILALDFESKRIPSFDDGDSLYSYIMEWSSRNSGRKYLFLDEIQEVKDWESCVRSLMKDMDSDIYLTGSSSKMLSGELATHLAGRYVEIHISPFSFSEVCDIMNEHNQQIFAEYLRNGGMPLVVVNRYDERMTPSILSAMYDSVIINDIVERNRIRDISALKRIISFIVSEIGHNISAKSISDYMKSQKKSISADTVIDYIDYAEDAMFIRKANRYDIKGKEVLKTDYKCYLSDLGIRESLGFSNTASIDQALENIVFNELIDRGYDVRVGKINDKEIDFVATKGTDVEYYQVTYHLSAESTVEREFGSLKMITDNHPKYILSMDEMDMSRDGIHHRNIIDWLLDVR